MGSERIGNNDVNIEMKLGQIIAQLETANNNLNRIASVLESVAIKKYNYIK